MDVERTMEFILEMQAKTASNLDQITERQNRAEERAAAADRRIERLERLARLGAGEFARHRGAMAELDEKLGTLAAMQVVTEQKLQAFLDALRKGNGRQ